MPVNILVVIIFAGLFIAGWHKGLLREVVAVAGTAFSYYGAWFLAGSSTLSHNRNSQKSLNGALFFVKFNSSFCCMCCMVMV